MTGTKGHSGGPGRGGGRKPKTKPGRKHLLPVWCTDEKYQEILDTVKIDDRANKLLDTPGQA